MASIDDLPEEILLKICDFLSYFTVQKKCTLVSKKWLNWIRNSSKFSGEIRLDPNWIPVGQREMMSDEELDSLLGRDGFKHSNIRTISHCLNNFKHFKPYFWVVLGKSKLYVIYFKK